MWETRPILEFAVALAAGAESLLAGRCAAHLGKVGEIELLEAMTAHGLLRIDGRGLIEKVAEEGDLLEGNRKETAL